MADFLVGALELNTSRTAVSFVLGAKHPNS